MIVFIDESGDPGFKVAKGSSPFFVIALVIFTDSLEAEKTSLAIKELRRKLHVADFYEFKFNKTDKRFKNAFFETVRKFDFKIRAIVIDKEIIRSQRLKTDKESFYNYTVMQVLKHNQGKIKNAKLKVDKRGERTLRNQLRVYLSHQLNNKSSKVFSDLNFEDSRQNTLIQLADMVAGCIAASYSGKNETYLKMLKDSKRIDDVWPFK